MTSPLLTDLYQLTMAYGYWKLGMHDREAVFQLFFRKNPFQGNYAVACGLGSVIEFIQNWQFLPADVAYLATLKAPSNEPLFPADFLDYLLTLRFSCDIDAIPEGTVVFAHEPLLRIKGPILQAQLLESALLNMINFQTLIATKATRVCHAAGGAPVLEFGMRRAQGPDGALSASRAAYIGGCTATSNVLAGQRFGIPLRGTHAHSWVTAFPDELTAFRAYAEVMPHNCVLLVDTYDTLQGVAHAIEVGKELRAQGSELLGIRLDSGDLAALSAKARVMLDAAGFENTRIVVSNSLNEKVIEQLHEQGAKISTWGVGTQLATAFDQPALDGVYKLSALKDAAGQWQYKIKISEQPAKMSNPGIYQVRRYSDDQHPIRDILYDIEMGISATPEMILLDAAQAAPTKLTDYAAAVDLLQPVYRAGQCVYPDETLHVMRQRAIQQVEQFYKHYTGKSYVVGLEKSLYDLKQQLIREFSTASES